MLDKPHNKSKNIKRNQYYLVVGRFVPENNYEVIIKGQHVNPINYYFMDLDAEGYDQMLQMAENHGKVYD